MRTISKIILTLNFIYLCVLIAGIIYWIGNIGGLIALAGSIIYIVIIVLIPFLGLITSMSLLIKNNWSLKEYSLFYRILIYSPLLIVLTGFLLLIGLLILTIAVTR